MNELLQLLNLLGGVQIEERDSTPAAALLKIKIILKVHEMVAQAIKNGDICTVEEIYDVFSSPGQGFFQVALAIANESDFDKAKAFVEKNYIDIATEAKEIFKKYEQKINDSKGACEGTDSGIYSEQEGDKKAE